MNKWIGTGRLGAAPEVRYTTSGKCVASFNLAVQRDKNTTDWLRVVAWEKTGELAGNHLSKGSKVLVEGRVQVRDYEVDGQKRRATEIVAHHIEFLDAKKPEQQENPFGGQDVTDEGIPF